MIKKQLLIAIFAVILAGCTQNGDTQPTITPQSPVMNEAQIPTTPAQATSDFTIENYTFLPKTLTVTAGQVVTVTNKDTEPHTVSSDDGESFESGLIAAGQTGSFLAPSAGTYKFHCGPHPEMTATLIVQ